MNYRPHQTLVTVALIAALGGCSSANTGTSDQPPHAARNTASDCAGASYRFTPITKSTVLAYLSAPQHVTAGAVPNDLMALHVVRAQAESSAGTADARAAYAAFLKKLDRDDAAKLGVRVGVPTSQFISSAPETVVVYRAPDVFTAQFARTCASGSGPTAFGTVSTWTNPRDGLVGCDIKGKMPAHTELAQRLGCG